MVGSGLILPYSGAPLQCVCNMDNTRNTRLTDYLASGLDVGSDRIQQIVQSCSTKTLPKGALLLKPGELCRHTFFVEQGFLRQYSIDEKGREHILQFAPENWFVSDRDSAYFGRKSQYFIQAHEDSVVTVIDEDFIRKMEREVPVFRDFNNLLLHNHIRHLQNRINLLLSTTSAERYQVFMKMYPDVLLRVPQSMIASYLGITPESLSRVRKKLARSE